MSVLLQSGNAELVLSAVRLVANLASGSHSPTLARPVLRRTRIHEMGKRLGTDFRVLVYAAGASAYARKHDHKTWWPLAIRFRGCVYAAGAAAYGRSQKWVAVGHPLSRTRVSLGLVPPKFIPAPTPHRA